MQIENKENVLLFHFKCQVDISTLNNLEKEVGDILVEYVEDADEFAWI